MYFISLFSYCHVVVGLPPSLLTYVPLLLVFLLYFIISLPRFRPSGLLGSRVSIRRVFPNSFALLVGNGEFGKGFLSGAFEEHGLSS